MFRITLDHVRKKETSQAIARQIITAMDKGYLKKGDTLPSERALADELNISRGTVRNAYNILKKQQCIVARSGSHHYIMGLDSHDDTKKQKALELTNEYILNMAKFGLTTDEVRSMLDMKLLNLEREKYSRVVHLGIIECRHEALFLFKRQLEHIYGLNISLYLLDEILSDSSLVKNALTCDMIITTASHYFEVCKNIPELEHKLVEVVTSWSEQTIFNLASIPDEAHIGIVYSSPRTITLIQNALKKFNINYKSLDATSEKNLRTFQTFCSSRTVLIAEPLSVIFDQGRQKELLQDFFLRGGKTIAFDHVIDRGSLLIIEQSITKIMKEKGIAK